MENQRPRRFIFNMVFVFCIVLIRSAVAAEPMEKEDLIRFAKEFSAAAIEGKNDVASFFDMEFLKEVVGYCIADSIHYEDSNGECELDGEEDADQIKQLKQQLSNAIISEQISEYQNLGADAHLTWKIVPLSCEMFAQSFCGELENELSGEDIRTLSQKYELHHCSAASLYIEIDETEYQSHGTLTAFVVGDRGNGLRVMGSFDYDEVDKLFDKSDERILLEGLNTEEANVQAFSRCDAKEVFNIEQDEIGDELFARTFLDEAAIEKGETIETLMQEIKERQRKARKMIPDGVGACSFPEKEIVSCREAFSVYEEFLPNIFKTLENMELSECSVDRVTFYKRSGEIISTEPFEMKIIKAKKNNEWMVVDLNYSIGHPQPKIGQEYPVQH